VSATLDIWTCRWLKHFLDSCARSARTRCRRAALGVNAAVWKAFAFGLGAAIAGLAGCFYPGFVGTLVPDAFGIVESFTMMAMVIVGGMGTMIGPVIGAVVLTFLPELLRGFGELRLMIYGVALTLVVLFMPGGIVQAWIAFKNRLA